MDLWATKTHAEREDEEAVRLVRPAPKQKPPRRDRRREQTEAERDPDLEGDEDLNGDPDLSRNYKNIGGSLSERVAARFVLARKPTRRERKEKKRIPVVKRDTGRTVLVTPDTLKKRPGEYEVVKEKPPTPPEEKPKAKEPGKPEVTKGREPERPSEPKEQSKPVPKEKPEGAKRPKDEAGRKLLEQVHGDERLLSYLRAVAAPDQVGGLAKNNPTFPLDKLGEAGKHLAEKTGVKTIGEVVEILEAGGGIKAVERAFKTKPKAPKTKPAEPSPSTEKPAEPQEKPAEAKGQPTRTKPPKIEEVEPEPEEAAPSTQKSPKEEAGAEAEAKPKKKAPKPKAEKPRAKEEPQEEVEEPSEAEKAGIGLPKRREASEAERRESLNLILDTFPPEMATNLIAKNLHPDDVGRLVETYETSKKLPIRDLGDFAAKAADFYEPDLDRVKPPKTWKNAAGQKVPFEDLPSDEQAEALRQHQVQVAAMSLAVREAMTQELMVPTSAGKPQIPRELARSLATFMLHKGDEKAGEKMGGAMFEAALTGGAGQALAEASPNDKTVRKLLANLTPGARKLASSFFQAADYHQAKQRFLGDKWNQVSERDSPKAIFRGLRHARSFFKERAKLYGTDDHRAQATFQVRLLDRLRSLDPEKYQDVRKLMAFEQKAVYDPQKAQYDKERKRWEAEKKAWEDKQSYRGEPFPELAPKEPPKPPLYHLAEEPQRARREAQAMFEDVLGRSKTASAIVRRFISTYSGAHAMGHVSNKTGVYHGVDPLKQYPSPYPDWQQGHQRDLGEADYTTILGKAKEWLHAPVLAVAINGIVRDQQCRAALDLAIRESRYADQIPPQIYNVLLARLGGAPEPGPGQTLLTIREARDSSFASPKKGADMKASPVSLEIRKLAAKAAESDPKIAYDLLDLAGRIETSPESKMASATAPASDERYSKLKSLVIRLAAADAEAKKALLPALQQIKTLG